MFSMCLRDKARIRKANYKDIQEIYTILCESFNPYKRYYTDEAFTVTVVPPHDIMKRIIGTQSDILVAIFENKIIGTATIELQETWDLHIRSVAVKPEYQRQGVGYLILEEISRIAKRKNARTLSLTCFRPLIEAFNLYRKFGFLETGKTKDLLGIEIFEMKKWID